MHFDDRLATVLRNRAAGETAVATQFRQLIDLLGESQHDGDISLVAAAYRRLDALSELLPAKRMAQIAGETGDRIRNPALLAWFAKCESDVAAPALSRARLNESQWVELIPALPIRARGLLRHRRDLPPAATAVLDRLGARDRVLPEPQPHPLPPTEPGEGAEEARAPEDNRGALSPDRDEETGIAALVKRIEAFQRARSESGESPQTQPDHTAAAPSLPGKPATKAAGGRSGQHAFLFSTDASGKIDWAEPSIAPQLVGMELATAPALDFNAGSGSFADSFAKRRPVRGVEVALAGADPISGLWLVDAAPRFTPGDGRFTGFVGRLRRRPEGEAAAPAVRAADRLRQLLHELRTPVNAIQGFAEVIQQQVFGPAPHEYRALAASIAGDAARILAGFEELERLARLESGTYEPVTGVADFHQIASRQISQLQSVLSTRVARFETEWDNRPCFVTLDEERAEMLAWRILGTLAAATGAGETITLDLAAGETMLELSAELPASLVCARNIFSTETRPAGSSVGVGLFGAGFAFRLARAEARAAGGNLTSEGERISLSLPLASHTADTPGPVEAPNGTYG